MMIEPIRNKERIYGTTIFQQDRLLVIGTESFRSAGQNMGVSMGRQQSSPFGVVYDGLG